MTELDDTVCDILRLNGYSSISQQWQDDGSISVQVIAKTGEMYSAKVTNYQRPNMVVTDAKDITT